MTADNELTILLTLKDRPLFSFRWMSYANRINFPFKVLIADGGKDEAVPKILSNGANFPNIDYEYIRYPYDQTYAEYYSKVVDALSRIKTPFVVMADNDDFFIVNGLRKAVQFLSSHPEYIACGGQCAFFWVTSSTLNEREGLLYGDQIEWKCSCDAQSMTAETARERIRNQSLSATDPSYYHVKRTEELRRQFQILQDLNLKDLFLVEYLIAFLTAIAGKTKRLETLYIARQHDSPGSSGIAHEEKFGDWFGRMLVQSWSDDFTKFVNITAATLAETDGVSFDEARDWVIKSYRMFVTPALLSNILEEPTVTMSMSVAVRIVRRLMQLPNDSRIRKLLRKLYRHARWISFDAVYGTEFLARPVSNSVREFKPISEFLTRSSGSVHTGKKAEDGLHSVLSQGME